MYLNKLQEDNRGNASAVSSAAGDNDDSWVFQTTTILWLVAVGQREEEEKLPQFHLSSLHFIIVRCSNIAPHSTIEYAIEE